MPRCDDPETMEVDKWMVEVSENGQGGIVFTVEIHKVEGYSRARYIKVFG